MTLKLLDLLCARSGIVCAVGAGGKKTTLYRLAAEHPGRLGLTATVSTAPFPSTLEAHTVVVPLAPLEAIEHAVVEASATHRVIAFAHPSAKRARLAGLTPDQVTKIHEKAGFQVTLVKADGARSRWIKAPADGEPVIPPGTTTVIPVISAHAIGAVLGEEVAHRVDRIEAVSGARRGEPLTAEHLARLLASPSGALKGVGDAQVVPLINMVDDPEWEAAAREAAEAALHLTRRFDRVVLASMRRPEPVVRVIGR
ncbi:MAG: selenium cofactor biosynthesis protein YqeC [Gemmatimonadota bacterium]